MVQAQRPDLRRGAARLLLARGAGAPRCAPGRGAAAAAEAGGTPKDSSGESAARKVESHAARLQGDTRPRSKLSF